MEMICHICDLKWIISWQESPPPSLRFKGRTICYGCYFDLIPAIYGKAGDGDGGLIHYAFKDLLTSNLNRKHRRSLRSNKKLFKTLLFRYKFSCVHCGEREESKLTIGHIHPVSKGGSDDIKNLQILCKSCNSKKGAKIGSEITGKKV